MNQLQKIRLEKYISIISPPTSLDPTHTALLTALVVSLYAGYFLEFISAIQAFFLGLVVFIFVYIIFSRWAEKAKRQWLLDLVNYITPHRDALMRAYSQKSRTGEYGERIDDSWHKEIDHFIEKIIPNSHIEKLHTANKGDRWHWVHDIINDYVELEVNCRSTGAISDDPNVDGMSGEEFEQHCASLLKDYGWRVHPTPRTGDQGVDLLARKAGRSVAIQCKRYTKPVGNKAVQEIAAGARFLDATDALVVSNADYTPAARLLAERLSVRLLHYTDLNNLDLHLGLTQASHGEPDRVGTQAEYSPRFTKAQVARTINYLHDEDVIVDAEQRVSIKLQGAIEGEVGLLLRRLLPVGESLTALVSDDCIEQIRSNIDENTGNGTICVSLPELAILEIGVNAVIDSDVELTEENRKAIRDSGYPDRDRVMGLPDGYKIKYKELYGETMEREVMNAISKCLGKRNQGALARRN